MDWWLWGLGGLVFALILALVGAWVFAVVMVARVGRGDLGDLNDLGGHDDPVRPGPGSDA